MNQNQDMIDALEWVAYAFEQNEIAQPDGMVVSWNPRLRTSAGRAHLMRRKGVSRGNIELSPALFERSTAEQKMMTAIHEACHVIAFIRNGSRSHDAAWAACMRRAGLPAEKTHDISTAGLHRRQQQHTYYCACGPHAVSTTIHNRIQRGAHYKCDDCGKRLLNRWDK